MDDKDLENGTDVPENVTVTNRKTDSTTPTVYPDVDFVNRTFP
jgi:hypothetical protein